MSVVPYKNSTSSKKEQVAEMFDNISPKYDLLNRLLSLGIDTIWRKKAINTFKGRDIKMLLDVATGTGDLAIEAMRLKPERIIGIDISEGMLAHGREKLKKLGLDNVIELRVGDSEQLLFADNMFDGVMVSFGVRNFENLDQGLEEIFRVLKPGGMLMVLEFSKPTVFPVKQLFGLYSKYILPRVGKAISKDSAAYGYLPESVAAFPDGAAFLDRMRKAGFTNLKCKPLTFGISSIYTGEK
jgi:demethylmenaquinone methyltransferase/2-methoxy-6-polyprenyl-1,4-benzoquinol methylase